MRHHYYLQVKCIKQNVQPTRIFSPRQQLQDTDLLCLQGIRGDIAGRRLAYGTCCSLRRTTSCVVGRERRSALKTEFWRRRDQRSLLGLGGDSSGAKLAVLVVFWFSSSPSKLRSEDWRGPGEQGVRYQYRVS